MSGHVVLKKTLTEVAEVKILKTLDTYKALKLREGLCFYFEVNVFLIFFGFKQKKKKAYVTFSSCWH